MGEKKEKKKKKKYNVGEGRKDIGSERFQSQSYKAVDAAWQQELKVLIGKQANFPHQDRKRELF